MSFILKTFTHLLTDPTFISDIYIHTLILFTFLSCLFIFYIVKLSTTGFKHHISTILDEFKPSFEQIKENPVFKYNIFNINFENLINNKDVEDKYVEKNNKNITSTLILLNVLLWVFIISIIVLYNTVVLSYDTTIRKHRTIDWVEELIQNIIIFSVIGAIEILFLNLIIVKFIPVEPSFISSKALEMIKNKFYVPDKTTI